MFTFSISLPQNALMYGIIIVGCVHTRLTFQNGMFASSLYLLFILHESESVRLSACVSDVLFLNIFS